jgi:hypothetical protein
VWKLPLTRTLAAALVAGGLVLSATACSGGGKDPKPSGGAAAGGKGLAIGKLSIAAPTGWQVKQAQSPDSFRVVVSGTCPDDPDKQSACKGFQLLGVSHVQPDENEGLPIQPYQLGEPHAAQYVQDEGYDCPADPKLRGADKSLGARLVGQGTATVGTQKAEYREWNIPCYTRGPNIGEPDKKTTVSYTERDWYLAASKTLIVDEWNTPNLKTLLAKATWS